MGEEGWVWGGDGEEKIGVVVEDYDLGWEKVMNDVDDMVFFNGWFDIMRWDKKNERDYRVIVWVGWYFREWWRCFGWIVVSDDFGVSSVNVMVFLKFLGLFSYMC